MSFLRRMLGKEPRESLQPQRLDYLNEGLALERQGDFEAALTSYRLAFRDNPSDSRILLNRATPSRPPSTCAPFSPGRPRGPTRIGGFVTQRAP